MLNKIYETIKKVVKDNFKFLISLIVIFVLFMYELPVVIYTPGGAVNLDDRIEVTDGYKSKGEISMAYVSVIKSSLPFVLASYVIPNWDLQKMDEVTYENASLEETIEIDKLHLKQSKDNAIIAAYNLADKNVEISGQEINVAYVDNKKSNLKVGDVILKINNIDINDFEDIKNALVTNKKDDTVKIKVLRKEKEKIVDATLVEIDGEVKLGTVIVKTFTYKTDPKIIIKSKNSESGSSGGLMMSLAIYNSLVKKDITNGKKIIGTGTIDEMGNVGEIDGVKYKLIGAVRKKADIFICPKENYEEAKKIKKDKKYNIKIISVDTLEEAIKVLERGDNNE